MLPQGTVSILRIYKRRDMRGTWGNYGLIDHHPSMGGTVFILGALARLGECLPDTTPLTPGSRGGRGETESDEGGGKIFIGDEVRGLTEWLLVDPNELMGPLSCSRIKGDLTLSGGECRRIFVSGLVILGGLLVVANGGGGNACPKRIGERT